jgi:hypothetical protein
MLAPTAEIPRVFRVTQRLESWLPGASDRAVAEGGDSHN